MTRTLQVVCPECGDRWGHYDGTTWLTPLEQAQAALGAIEHEHELDETDFRVV
jgi:hypothetical protein